MMARDADCKFVQTTVFADIKASKTSGHLAALGLLDKIERLCAAPKR
eukprot:SAG22_NODE_153_length_17315_cov_69.981935_11_plen_47_part_00